MESVGSTEPAGLFSQRRRTAVILTGEGTAAAYLAGVLKGLDDAGVRIDLIQGRGAGALVAAFGAVGAGDRLYGEEGLFASFERLRPHELRARARVAAALLALAFAAFLAPIVVGLVSLVVLPLALLAHPFTAAGAAGQPDGVEMLSSSIAALLQGAAPLYLRAVALPVVALFVALVVWWGRSVWRGGGLREPARGLGLGSPAYRLDRLRRRTGELLWQTVRGASSEPRARDPKELSEAFVELLSGSLGQTGFRELVLYALDVDAGRETRFALLKERFSKRWQEELGHEPEPIDLSHGGKALAFDALIAAASPYGLAREVAIALPLGTKSGGECHGFASSVLASESAVSDALAAGAEQILYVTACVPNEPVQGNAWERAAEAALRVRLDEDLRRIGAAADVPIFVIRPERTRRRSLDFPLRSLAPRFAAGAGASERTAAGDDAARIDLRALVAHGERDAHRLFVRPALGLELAEPDERTIPITAPGRSAGPREL